MGYHQVKLFSSWNQNTGATEEKGIIFGFNHDYKYGKKMMAPLPADGVGVMDRGFAGLKFLQNTVKSDKYFVLRIGNRYKLEFDQESELTQLGTGRGG